eukprot:9302551-Karenia_brevis.AAC.1
MLIMLVVPGQATEEQSILMAREDGHVPKWEDCQCPWCGKGKLGELKFQANRWCHKCNHYDCKKYVLPHAFHPVFQVTQG